MTEVHALQELLVGLADDASRKLAEVRNRRAVGGRDGQYGLDLIVDEPLVQALLDAGLGVLSEEAGVISEERALLAVVDPVDGSTNASRLLPWCATSICIFDDDGPWISLVENLITRERFEAVRGGGALHNGQPMGPTEPVVASERVVLVNGTPPAERPWSQFRCLGASALDISYVAAGNVDGYVDFDDEAHGVWDYAGAMLVCTEVGAVISDAFDRDLVHRDHTARRTPVVAHDEHTLQEFLDVRRLLRENP